MLPDDARVAHVLPVTLAAAGDRSWRVRWSAASKYEAVCQAFVAAAKKEGEEGAGAGGGAGEGGEGEGGGGMWSVGLEMCTSSAFGGSHMRTTPHPRPPNLT